MNASLQKLFLKRERVLCQASLNVSDETNKEPNTQKSFKSKVIITKRSDIVNKSTFNEPTTSKKASLSDRATISDIATISDVATISAKSTTTKEAMIKPREVGGELSIRKIIQMAKENKFPKKEFLVENVLKYYTTKLHFSTSTRVFKSELDCKKTKVTKT